jgi:transketolase
MRSSNQIRNSIIEIAAASEEGHIASSFSIVELLLAISEFENDVGVFEPSCVVLSKGHASYAYYAFLHHMGLMDGPDLETVGQVGSKYYGHLPYIENDERFQFGSGSLGHGLPFSVGLAHGTQILKKSKYIYCIVGDGEINEGTFWESLLLLQKLKITNLKILVDCNSSSERAIPISDTLKNLKYAFKCLDFIEVDGHSISSLVSAMSSHSKAQILLCNTIKGYPVSFMQNNPVWHHRTPNKSEIIQIKAELT